MSSGPKSLHVIPSLRLSSGGPTESVSRLCESLNALGAPAEIATVASPGDEGVPPSNTPVHAFPIAWPHALRRSPALRAFVEREAARFDVIHVHALWQWPGTYGRRASLLHHKPLIISPRGMLEPWSLQQSAGLKRIALHSWEGRNLRAADLLHATSEAEAAQFRTLGLTNESRVIPNGVNTVAAPPTRPPSPEKTLLFLSRFHPKKGGDLLIRAWSQLHESFQDWRLALVGPDPEGFRPAWEELAMNLGIPGDRISFQGPVEGKGKWDLIGAAGLLVLPSHSENFGNVVLESLACGVPVITTHGTPWQGLEEHRCGWWIPCEEHALRETLRAGLALPEEQRRAMGERGRAWSHEFSWGDIARRMAKAYQEMIESRHRG